VKEDKVLRIAINLEGEMKKEFLEVQQKLGIKNRTDVLRWLIRYYNKHSDDQ